MLQHETKVNPQQLWENEWEDEELSDAQLKNICGGTGDYVDTLRAKATEILRS